MANLGALVDVIWTILAIVIGTEYANLAHATERFMNPRNFDLQSMIGTIWFDKDHNQNFIVLKRDDRYFSNHCVVGFEILFDDYHFSWCAHEPMTVSCYGLYPIKMRKNRRVDT